MLCEPVVHRVLVPTGAKLQKVRRGDVLDDVLDRTGILGGR